MAKNDPKVDRLGALRAIYDALSTEIHREERQQLRKKKEDAAKKRAAAARKRAAARKGAGKARKS